MKKLILCTILVFALTSHAYGMGWFGGGRHNDGGSIGGSSTTTNNSGGNGAMVQESNNTSNTSNPVAVPEPATLLLLGAGLGVIVGLRKKLKKG